jgi:hypothetical protein
MKRSALLLVVLCVALSATANRPATASDMTDAQKALAAILALGVGVAIAKHGKDHDHNTHWDEDRYGKPFSPSANVVCIPRQERCYDHGHLSHRWTRRIFGS